MLFLFQFQQPFSDHIVRPGQDGKKMGERGGGVFFFLGRVERVGREGREEKKKKKRKQKTSLSSCVPMKGKTLCLECETPKN